MGCVRLTNWDAEELAGLVRIGGTSVEFLDSGVSIADVTGRGQPVAPPPAQIALPEDTATDMPAAVAEQPYSPAETEGSDALGNALSGVLPEGFVVPLPADAQP
jgi:hypothetical protein